MNENTDLDLQIDAIVKTLPTRAKIFLPTEKIPLPEQLQGLKRVQTIYTPDRQEFYASRLRRLKTGMQGKKRCFLIGNGPSLNKTDLSLLKDEITFCVNGFFLKSGELDWFPTFYIVEDHLVAEDRAEALKSLKGPIKLFPTYLGYCFEEADDTIFYNHQPRVSYPDGFDFSLQADRITYTGCTVMFSAMQLAAYFGFTEIYLIGVDADYTIPDDVKNNADYDTGVLDMDSDDINHFHPDYFGKGYRWHDPQLGKMIEAYKEARKVCDANDIAIKNATQGGQLEVFDRAEYETLFSPLSAPLHDYPKQLLIDFTPSGHQTKMDELKETFLAHWPREKLMQIHTENGTRFEIHHTQDSKSMRYKYQDAVRQVEKFDPDIILYRPVINRPDLHQLTMQLIAKLDRPYGVWIMDDAPAEPKLAQAGLEENAQSSLETLCSHANGCLAASKSMCGALGVRYGNSFKVFKETERPDFENYMRIIAAQPFKGFAPQARPLSPIEAETKGARNFIRRAASFARRKLNL